MVILLELSNPLTMKEIGLLKRQETPPPQGPHLSPHVAGANPLGKCTSAAWSTKKPWKQRVSSKIITM
jgi:hypothetical protein